MELDRYQNPFFTEQEERIVIPCCLEHTASGFVIEGIKKELRCLDSQSELLALVYHFLLRDTSAGTETFAALGASWTALTPGQAQDVFGLAIVMLMLLRHNAVLESHQFRFACELPDGQIRLSVELLNHYGTLFAGLTGIPFTRISYRKAQSLKISLCGKEADIRVRRILDAGICREMWYGSRITYHLTEQHLPGLTQLLREISPFDSFAEGQLEALTAVLNHPESHVCIMPTGSGKSLLFYLAALLQPVPLLVIVPTRILILDQLRNLRETHHIDDASYLAADEDADFRCFDPHTRLIYMTPATFQNRDLLARFSLMDRGTEIIGLREEMLTSGPRLGYVVLDEIHCISNWGHDFRPEYLMLSRHLNSYLPSVPVLGLTGTADYPIANDIQDQLSLETRQIISPIAYEKFNMQFRLIRSASPEDMHTRAVSLIQKQLDAQIPTIVFVKTDAAARRLSAELSEEVCLFLQDDLTGYQSFLEQRSCVLIAGKELGVGVNLPQVQCTIHVGLPLSKNTYVQETGRAGRAGGNCISYLLYLDPAYPGIPPSLFTRGAAEKQAPSCCDAHDYAEIIASIYHYPSLQALSSRLTALYRQLEGQNSAIVTKPCDADPAAFAETKKLLYLLYQMGYLEDWYLRISPGRQVQLMINIRSTKSHYYGIAANMQNRMMERCTAFMVQMEADSASIRRIRQAESIEKVIALFCQWYYAMYIYRHKETFLDLFEFVQSMEGSTDDRISEEIRNYYALPYIRLKDDESRFKGILPRDALSRVCRGISRTTLSNLERILERRYDASLEYLLFLGEIRYSRFSAARLERILSRKDPAIRTEVLKALTALYPMCSLECRFALLKWAELHPNLLGIGFEALTEMLFAASGKDEIYYGLLSMRLNSLFGRI